MSQKEFEITEALTLRLVTQIFTTQSCHGCIVAALYAPKHGCFATSEDAESSSATEEIRHAFNERKNRMNNSRGGKQT